MSINIEKLINDINPNANVKAFRESMFDAPFDEREIEEVLRDLRQKVAALKKGDYTYFGTYTRKFESDKWVLEHLRLPEGIGFSESRDIIFSVEQWESTEIEKFF